MTNYFRAAYYLVGMMRRTYWKREKLVKYQARKLRRILRYAYDNVPFYHDMFRKENIRPSDIMTPQDLKRLPLVRKSDIGTDVLSLVSEEYNFDDLKKVVTSGSTGHPFTVYLRQNEDEFRKTKHLRANIAVGQKPRDRWVMTVPPWRMEEVARLQKLLGFFVITPVSSFEDIASQLSLIEKAKPDVLDGYSNSLLLIAKEVKKRKLETIKPKLIIGGAELISASSRRFIEETFQVPFYDQYACIELERMAWQCKEKTGYHIDADSLIMQFVDEDGEEVAPGERGEIVCTSLFNEAMPLIRYVVGDVGTASEEPDCPCGRTFPLMKIIEGRKDSFITLPDGRILAPTGIIGAFDYMDCLSKIDQFRVVQRNANSLDIQIKLRDRSSNLKIIEKSLRDLFQKALKINPKEVSIQIDFLDHIPLQKGGKFSSVVSELSQPAEPNE